MTSTEEQTVLGRPVHGTPCKGYKTRYEQWSGEKFLELLDAVLDHPRVLAVRWRQYTPYFNDGDPCEFGVGEFGVKIAKEEGEKFEYLLVEDDDFDEDDEDQEGDYGDGFISDYGLWDYEPGNYSKRVYKPGMEEIAAILSPLQEAQGHCETFLYDSFGDHAVITATKEGFRLEEYSHD